MSSKGIILLYRQAARVQIHHRSIMTYDVNTSPQSGFTRYDIFWLESLEGRSRSIVHCRRAPVCSRTTPTQLVKKPGHVCLKCQQCQHYALSLIIIVIKEIMIINKFNTGNVMTVVMFRYGGFPGKT